MKLQNLLLLGLLLAFGCSKIPKTKLNFMTFNVRYDNPEDGDQNWKFRKDHVTEVIRFHDLDFVGMQEVLHNQLLDISERLPEYGFVGVARENGKEEGEYAPIFYLQDKFKCIGSGTFWLSETPDKPSIGWDACCLRIATWGIFREFSSGIEFVVFNTHFDHIGKIARNNSAGLLLEKIKELANGRTVVITGDFNATPYSETIQIMTENNGQRTLLNSSQEAQLSYGPQWTFHDFGKVPPLERETIDYIFVGQGVKVLKYGVLSEDINEVYLSDHCPVLIQLVIDRKE